MVRRRKFQLAYVINILDISLKPRQLCSPSSPLSNELNFLSLVIRKISFSVWVIYSFAGLWHSQASGRIHSVAKWADFGDKRTREMQPGSLDSRDGGEYNGVGLVELSWTYLKRNNLTEYIMCSFQEWIILLAFRHACDQMRKLSKFLNFLHILAGTIRNSPGRHREIDTVRVECMCIIVSTWDSNSSNIVQQYFVFQDIFHDYG